MCFYIPIYVPLLALVAVLLFGTTSIINSIIAFKDAKALEQDLRLRRDAAAAAAAAAAASHAELAADLELRVDMARAAVEAKPKKPKEDETKPKLKKLEEDLKKMEEDKKKDKKEVGDLEARLRLLELRGVVQGERLADVKRRFDAKFD
ncbi:hypothetical protein F4821DRAFT_243787 [Hypoxylon rubiginosum]|uniref:Uncharacterized protein n=1 Tax=Hypoxylon rubiginosum TaxID=110542 RepID=A0ACC0CTZ1_9PEZI|nr:hypothetical protein F4821DRAFT_243787 [Hypoxylon rubiginosum]